MKATVRGRQVVHANSLCASLGFFHPSSKARVLTFQQTSSNQQGFAGCLRRPLPHDLHSFLLTTVSKRRRMCSTVRRRSFLRSNDRVSVETNFGPELQYCNAFLSRVLATTIDNMSCSLIRYKEHSHLHRHASFRWGRCREIDRC